MQHRSQDSPTGWLCLLPITWGMSQWSTKQNLITFFANPPWQRSNWQSWLVSAGWQPLVGKQLKRGKPSRARNPDNRAIMPVKVVVSGNPRNRKQFATHTGQQRVFRLQFLGRVSAVWQCGPVGKMQIDHFGFFTVDTTAVMSLFLSYIWIHWQNSNRHGFLLSLQTTFCYVYFNNGTD